MSPQHETLSLEKGDYVLATKYWDDDPLDHWCIGFYDHSYHSGAQTRHMVVNDQGQQFRGNGFRCVKKISLDIGHKMLLQRHSIENSGVGIWTWLAELTEANP